MRATPCSISEEAHADKVGDDLVLKLRQTRNQLTHKKAALKKTVQGNLTYKLVHKLKFYQYSS